MYFKRIKMAGAALEIGDIRSSQQPQWFTPNRLLMLFCCINLLNHLDRGIIASNGVNGVLGDAGCLNDATCIRGTSVQGEFGLTSLQDGILSSAFMAGRLAASPVFAHLAEFCLPIIMFISYCLCCSAR
ncbi:probable sphingolipid transporter spinster homolog 2 isoform X2 [Physcomitrium patens]